jgi:hypothetical protein
VSAPFILPTAVPGGGSGWQYLGYKDPSPVLVTPPAAAGSGTMRVVGAQVPPQEQWVIDRAVVSSTSTSTTSVRLYDGSVAPGLLLSGSNAGNYDEADYPAGLLLGATSQLLVVWTGAGDGAVGTIRLQVRAYRMAGA